MGAKHEEIDQALKGIVAALQKEGYRDYSPSFDDGRKMRICFCGLSGVFKNDHMIALSGHDIDMVISDGHFSFVRGDKEALFLWADRLSSFASIQIKAPFAKKVIQNVA